MTYFQKDSGKQLPSWADSVYPDKMKDIAALVLASFTDTTTMKKFKGGDEKPTHSHGLRSESVY